MTGNEKTYLGKDSSEWFNLALKEEDRNKSLEYYMNCLKIDEFHVNALHNIGCLYKYKSVENTSDTEIDQEFYYKKAEEYLLRSIKSERQLNISTVRLLLEMYEERKLYFKIQKLYDVIFDLYYDGVALETVAYMYIDFLIKIGNYEKAKNIMFEYCQENEKTRMLELRLLDYMENYRILLIKCQDIYSPTLYNTKIAIKFLLKIIRCHYKLKGYNEILALYEEGIGIMDDSDHSYKVEKVFLEYYVGLAYLKLDCPEMAKKHLMVVKQSNLECSKHTMPLYMDEIHNVYINEIIGHINNRTTTILEEL